jgi:hypothetical protein
MRFRSNGIAHRRRGFGVIALGSSLLKRAMRNIESLRAYSRFLEQHVSEPFETECPLDCGFLRRVPKMLTDR